MEYISKSGDIMLSRLGLYSEMVKHIVILQIGSKYITIIVPIKFIHSVFAYNCHCIVPLDVVIVTLII